MLSHADQKGVKSRLEFDEERFEKTPPGRERWSAANSACRRLMPE
jgi:hypothetical protein